MIRNQKENLDCDGLRNGLDRVFCDLHCIRDAVKAGDSAILKTLEKSVQVMGSNMDMLLEYHTGTAKDELMEAIDSLQPPHDDDDLLENAHEVQAQLLGMFTEMGSMLNANLDAGGHATATRALDSFAARFSAPDPLTSNHTKLMHELASESTSLLNTVRAASSRQLSTSAEASRRTSSAVRKLNQALGTRNQMLGVYSSSAQTKKETQRNMSPTMDTITALKNDIQRSSATTLLLDLDRSWWTIREKLDEYLDAAQGQTAAFTDALIVVEDYSSKCAADFDDLKHAHVQALQADKAAQKQLQESWHAVEHQFGMLAAKIADSHGFLQLAHLDASSLDFETNRTAICSQGKPAKEAALLAVDRSLSQGLAKQTWKQLTDVFDEMGMLRSRFSAHGLKTPKNQTLIQALERTATAYMEAMDQRSDIALEAARRVCGQESTLAQISLVDEETKKIGALEAALKTVRDMEGAKDLANALALEKDEDAKKLGDLKDLALEAKDLAMEKEMEKNQMEEKLHTLQVHELEEKIRNLEARK